MRALVPLLVASLLTLTISLSLTGPSSSAAVGHRLAPARPASRPTLRTDCAEPRALRLRRFEDGSARLECARRILVRVSVPG